MATNVLTSVGVIQLTSTLSTVYTVPSGKTFTVAVIHLANTSSSVANVRLCLNTGSGSQATALLWDFQIQANDVLEILKGDIWSQNMILSGYCLPTTTVNIKVAGIETTP
jgi:hypothetical protein